MESCQQDMCLRSSMNARAIEGSLLTYDSVINLTKEDAEDIIERCQQIINCMKECFVKKRG